MALRLLTYPGNYRAYKVLIAAQYAGVKIETPDFKIGTDNKSAAFLEKNPNGKVPVLETPEGAIYESSAILRYIARLRADSGLMGSTAFAQSQVDQWIDWSGFELEVARGAWIYPILGIAPFDAAVNAKARELVNKFLGILNTHFLKNTYLVGNSVTAADIVVFTAVLDLVKLVLTKAVLAKYPNFYRWFETIAHQPQVEAVVGKVEVAKTEAAPAGAPAPAEKKEAGKKEAKKEVKKEAPKKVEPKAEEAAPAPVEKKVNPLDTLPPSPMVLDAVKKSFFLNKPYNPKFFSEFWPQFDAAGYSIWTCDYKYNADFTKLFLAGNLMGGYLQRCELCRKYAMGTLLLSGADEERPPWDLRGCWIFRGQDVIAEMRNVDDSELYTWTKLDTSKPEARKLVEELFTADDFNGQPVQDRRYFK